MQTRVTEEARVTSPVEGPEAERVSAPALPATEEVVEFIRRDALSSPREYLDEVHVPHGGE